MKRLTAHVTYTLVRILVVCAGIIRGDCPSEMIRVGHLCYKWYASAVSFNEAFGTCGKNDGHLAGFENGNFLEIIRENPVLEEYLPKEKCFWVVLPPPSLRLSSLWWLKSGIGMFLDVFTHSKMCYKKTKWVEDVVYNKRKVSYVCEREVSLFEEHRRRRDEKEVKSIFNVVSVVRMEKESTFIADQHLFEEGAPVPTMCSRLCKEFIGCSIFNYNKLTKQCRGFGEMGEWHIHYHSDWEVWVFQ